jgi:hypothetical protein
MIKLYDQAGGTLLGEITEAQFQFLVEHLEEESLEDQDYYLNQATLAMLEQAGAEPELLTVLRRGMGNREEMDIRWSHD